MKKIILATLALMSIYVNAQVLSLAEKADWPDAGKIVGVKKTKDPKRAVLSIREPQKTSFLLQQMSAKKVTTIEEFESGAKLQIVELENGEITKRYLLPGEQKETRNIRSNTKQRASSTQNIKETFVESFEKWDGLDTDWLPEGWVDESKTNLVAGKGTNLTWRTDVTNGNDGASHGLFMAAIQVSLPSYGKPAVAQDEWMITPSITVETDNDLYFDLGFRPGLILINPATLQFDNENTTLEVYVSTDNGTTWNKEWSATDEARNYTRAELWADSRGTTSTWIEKKVSLSKYVGKKIKIAFRYVGVNGGSICIDYVRVSTPAPIALYRHPYGTFIVGFSEDYLSFSEASFILSPAYKDDTWDNYSSKHSENFKWIYEDPSNGSMKEVNDINLTIQYPFYVSTVPTLNAYAMNNKYSSSFQWGGTNIGYNQSGGGTSFSFADGSSADMGAGNYDINQAFTIGMINEGSYLFGTNNKSFWGGTIEGLGEFFEKPQQKYAFDKFWINCLDFKADDDAELEIIVYRVDDYGNLADTLAKSICYPAEVTEYFNLDGFGYFTIPFSFEEEDPITGRKRPTWIEVESAIFVEFRGFSDGRVKSIAPCYQALSHPTYDNFAYIFISDGSSTYLYPVSSMLRNTYTSFLFNMNVVFPFMFTEDNQYNVPAEGGTKEFSIMSYYTDVNWWYKESLPSWITLGKATVNSSSESILPVKVEPLPAGVKGRSHDLTISSYASEVTLHISQGNTTDMDSESIDDLKAIYSNDSYLLTYPEVYNTVSVLNMSGQVIAIYELPMNGSFEFPVTNLSKGLYMLKFGGEKNATIKIVR